MDDATSTAVVVDSAYTLMSFIILKYDYHVTHILTDKTTIIAISTCVVVTPPPPVPNKIELENESLLPLEDK